MKRVLWIGLGLVALLVGLGLWGWLAAPRVLQVSPLPGSQEVPVGAPLRIVFSGAMRPEMVQERLQTDPPEAGTFTWEGNTLVFTPDVRWSGGITVTVTLQAGSRLAAGPGWPMWQDYSWSFHTSQTLLAYLWPSGEPANLYALDPVSGEVVQWTEIGGVLDFKANQDGTVVYLSIQNRNGGSDIYRLDRALAASDPAAALIRILTCPDALCHLPQPGPGGDWLAYERALLADEEPATQVWLLPLNGTKPRLAGSPEHSTSQPEWSANGWLAFYDRDEAGYVLLDPDLERRLLISNQTGESASWQPDGKAFVAAEILFENAGTLQSYASSHLLYYGMPEEPAGSVPPALDLTQDVAIEDADPVYSPDSTQLAFARKYLDLARWSPGRQLWVMPAGGGPAQQLSAEPLYNHYDFAWSTNAQQIAYVRFHQTVLTLPPELWLVSLDGSDPIQLVIGGYAPQWIP